MTTTFTDRDHLAAPTPDPAPATTTHNDGDPSAGRSEPVAATPAMPPVTMCQPIDKSNWLFCHGCKRYKPPEGRAGFRCADCAAKAKTMPKSYSEPEPYIRLYDNAGKLIKQPKKKKARVAAPASDTTTIDPKADSSITQARANHGGGSSVN